MSNYKLVLANHDARIKSIDIKPKNVLTTIKMNMVLSDGQKVIVKFVDVGSISFEINFFYNMIGAESLGLYELLDDGIKRNIVKNCFENRRILFPLAGYDYEKNEPDDLLNCPDINEIYKQLDEYHLYIQYVDAGCYVILAKAIEIDG